MARELIQEAVRGRARLWKACEVLEITVRTYQRWGKSSPEGDARHGPRSKPANTLSIEERVEVIAIATSERFRELAPSQIVPTLAEEGVYVASESSLSARRHDTRGGRHRYCAHEIRPTSRRAAATRADGRGERGTGLRSGR
jgi:hypothetical protein